MATKRTKPVKAKEPKVIKPPVPSKRVKPKPRTPMVNSRTGALGTTSGY